MKVELKKQTYGWRHILWLPFLCDPWCTVGVVAQKALTGVVNVLWVVVEARVIDLALSAALGKKALWEGAGSLAAMLLIVFWKRMGYNFGRLCTRRAEINSNYLMNREVVKKRAKLQYYLIEDQKTWELMSRVEKDMKSQVWGMLQQTCNAMLAVVRIVGVFLILFTESAVLGVMVLVVSIPLVIFSVQSGKRNYSAYQEAEVYERRSGYLRDLLTGRDALEERTLFNFTGEVGKRWHEQKDISRRVWVKAKFWQEGRLQLGGAIANIVSTGIALGLVAQLAEGKLSIGVFIALTKAIYDMIGLICNELGRSMVSLAHNCAFMKDLTKFVNLPETEGANDLPAQTPPAFETLEFRGVSFRYPGQEQYILKNMDFRMQKGMHYAFVGENGAGKTTVTKLLTGLYDHYEGSILLNGKELREYPPAVGKAVFSNVWQDFARYQDTAAANILIGNIRCMEDPGAAERMRRIAEGLGILQEVEALPQGFDTHLGKLEEGVDLSGGQWQRLAMARSLMNPAPIQILDEPTSALDPITESGLYEEFEKVSRGRTTIFISHRLGSTKIADKIFVLGEGRMLEEGSHEELMAKGGLYRRMYESQQSWYL